MAYFYELVFFDVSLTYLPVLTHLLVDYSRTECHTDELLKTLSSCSRFSYVWVVSIQYLLFIIFHPMYQFNSKCKMLTRKEYKLFSTFSPDSEPLVSILKALVLRV